jgi:hypothetical protein
MINSFKHSRKISQILGKRIHTRNEDVKTTIKYNFLENPSQETLSKFEKEYFPTHWLHKHLPRPDRWITTGEQVKVFDFDKDSELGRYSWNSNGCYSNRIANLFYRSPAYITLNLDYKIKQS